jgi:hypothetical protein
MSTPEPPDDQEKSAQAPTDEGSDDSIVSPPAYPAYSTPPPQGLATNEDG